MKKSLSVFIVILFVVTIFPSSQTLAESDSSDIIKSGLLGAGAGAVGGAASGAKGGDLWKGALAGAGVNIVGGALLDSISGEKVRDVKDVDSSSARNAYSTGYEDGYHNAYRQGYTDGLKDGIKESSGGSKD